MLVDVVVDVVDGDESEGIKRESGEGRSPLYSGSLVGTMRGSTDQKKAGVATGKVSQELRGCKGDMEILPTVLRWDVPVVLLVSRWTLVNKDPGLQRKGKWKWK